MLEKFVVACVLLTPSEHLRLQSRKGISKYGEEWSFFGGHRKIGESISDTCIREAKEELNLELTESDIHHI